MAFRLFVDSSNGVTIYPEWDYKRDDRKQENTHRVRSGRLFVYLWGDWERWKFKVSYTNSSDASIVNSWWRSNTPLLWMEEGDTVVNSVLIRNKKIPISGYNRPYQDLFKGVIELETY